MLVVGFWILLGLGGAVLTVVLLILEPVLGLGPDSGLFVGLTGVLQIVVCAALVAAGWTVARRPLATLVPLRPFSPRLLAPIAVFAIGAGIVASELDNLLRHLLPAPDFLLQMRVELLTGGLGALFALAVAAPLSEELLFRGLILDGLRRRYPAGKAIVLSAVLFALAHLNPYQLAIAFGLGLFLAWLVLRTGSLWPAIWAHAGANGFGWVTGNWLPGDIPGLTDFAEVAFHPWWLDAAGLLLLVLGFLAVRAALPSPRGETPQANSWR